VELDASLAQRRTALQQQGIAAHHADPIRVVLPERGAALLRRQYALRGEVLVGLEEVQVRDAPRTAQVGQQRRAVLPCSYGGLEPRVAYDLTGLAIGRYIEAGILAPDQP